MSDKEVLERVIQKAINNGWQTAHFDTLKASYKHPEDSEFTDILGKWHGISPLDVLFDYQFAKALWGDGTIACYNCTEGGHSEDHGTSGWGEIFVWQHHLQQLAIAEDRIKYLRDNMPKENI